MDSCSLPRRLFERTRRNLLWLSRATSLRSRKWICFCSKLSDLYISCGHDISCMIFLQQRRNTWQIFFVFFCWSLVGVIDLDGSFHLSFCQNVLNFLCILRRCRFFTLLNFIFCTTSPLILIAKMQRLIEIIIRISRSELILLPSLRSTTITFLPKRKIQVIAVQTDPISFSGLRDCLGMLGRVCVKIFDGGCEGVHDSIYAI